MSAPAPAPGSDAARFTTLLVAQLGLFLIAPFVGRRGAGLPLFELAFTAILISGVFAVSRRPRVLWGAVALSVPALLCEWASRIVGSEGLWIANHVTAILFLAYMCGAVFVTVTRRRRVTLDTIAGGICVYLLIGSVFMEIFNMIEMIEPGSFMRGDVAVSSLGGGGGGERRSAPLLYFSYVTLTTLGYGDIVPTNDVAQAFCVAEAIVGQLYVAIFVAGLVALHIAEARPDGAGEG